MQWSGGERQCPERSAATVKLLPKAGREYLFLASPGAAFRTRVASTRGCVAVTFGVVSDEVEGMMHGRRGNVLTRLVLSSLLSSSFSFHFISVAVSRDRDHHCGRSRRVSFRCIFDSDMRCSFDSSIAVVSNDAREKESFRRGMLSSDEARNRNSFST